MYVVVFPQHDCSYFEEKYELKPMPEFGEDPIALDANGFKYYGVIRSVDTPPSETFKPEELIEPVHLIEGLSAAILARPYSSDSNFEVTSVMTTDEDIAADSSEWLREQMLDSLEILARVTGFSFELVSEGWNIVAPSTFPGTIRVVLTSPTPGFCETYTTQTLFGHAVCGESQKVRLPKPSVDIGTVVINDSGEEIAQIIHNTLYLFIPTVKESHLALSQEGHDIFRKTLALAWVEYLDKNPDTTRQHLDVPAVNSAEDLAALESTMEKQIEELRSDIAKIDDEIRAARKRLTLTLAMKREAVERLAGAEAMPTIDHESAWKNLNECPHFDKAVMTSDERVHYFTKPLVVVDQGGEERYLGRFGIRFQSVGEICVWSLDYPHYGGVPHPHISIQGSVCLGNVTESVTQLLVDYKETEAAILVMRLLAEGYDPTLADRPIEEWPTPKKWKIRERFDESIASVSHA